MSLHQTETSTLHQRESHPDQTSNFQTNTEHQKGASRKIPTVLHERRQDNYQTQELNHQAHDS